MNLQNMPMPEGENNSGKGGGYPVPPGVKGWSWGAFFLNWIWAIGNRTWIGLLVFIPYVGIIMTFVLGFKGREWAWQNKPWRDMNHFNRVQRLWSIWGGIFVFVTFGSVLAAIVIPLLIKTPEVILL